MRITLLALALSGCWACGQQPAGGTVRLSGRVALPAVAVKSHPPAVVVWLTPLDKSVSIQSPPPGRFRLIQKNRTFTPHLLVVPVGSLVSFPNEDPFFHNVFSLFNGKRFDLGLYEAGGSRDVAFSREGISYIFCNIHPEMSAVVISLATPFYDVVGPTGAFSIHSIPPGAYQLHVWIEGTPQIDLDRLSRNVTLKEGASLSIVIDASDSYHPVGNHLNMFGKPYPSDYRPPY